uniref:Uncharacterized protein n=1 Tax=Malurus cyaneus samueli TaxID=2593467 RepID=A0A8C5X1W8_9PASS
LLRWSRPILDMSYSRHFLDFQGSSIPSSMKKLVVTKLSQNFREAVTLHPGLPTPGRRRPPGQER